MSNPFASAYAKLDRAEEHMAELRRRLVEHMSRPDVVVGKVDYDPRAPAKDMPLTHIRLAAVPHSVPVVVGDVVHNLRSALDHVAWQLVKLNGGTPVEPPERPVTQFPIWTREPKEHVAVAGGISEQALAIVRETQPFACPDWRGRLLGALAYISNTDKHRETVHGRKRFVGWLATVATDPQQSWSAPIQLGAANEHQVELFFAIHGDPTAAGGKATHWIDIETSADGDHEPLYRTLDDISWAVRQLVDRLVATAAP